MATTRSRARRADRRGIAAVELLFILPVLLVVLTGMVGIGDLLVTEQIVSEASGRAARTAALGGSHEQVVATAHAILGPDRAKLADVAQYLIQPDGKAIPVEPDTAIPPGSLIEVRITLPARRATATHLAPLGDDDKIIGRAVMQRE